MPIWLSLKTGPMRTRVTNSNACENQAGILRVRQPSYKGLLNCVLLTQTRFVGI